MHGKSSCPLIDILDNIILNLRHLMNSLIKGRKLAPGPQLLAKEIKPYWNRNQDSGDTAQQGGSPLNTHAVEHLPRK